MSFWLRSLSLSILSLSLPCKLVHWLCLSSLPAACEVGFYKPVAGDGLCGKCPQHSHSETRAALSCPCDSDFYRAADDPPAAPCSRKPKHASRCLAIIGFIFWGVGPSVVVRSASFKTKILSRLDSIETKKNNNKAEKMASIVLKFKFPLSQISLNPFLKILLLEPFWPMLKKQLCLSWINE